MRSKADAQKAWKDSLVSAELTVVCGCGERVTVDGTDIDFESLRRSLSAKGWRFNDAGTHCLCPVCGPRKYPELYSNVRVSDSPRHVRRVGVSSRKQAEEEVRKPRRVRGG